MKNYKVMFYFLSPNVYCYLFCFLNSQIKCFIFPQKFCVVYLVIKWRHKTCFMEMLCDLSLKKGSFHNFSSSVMYILLNKYFCCTVFKKNDFYFDELPWIPLHFCDEDMKRFYSNETVKRWWSDSEQFWGCCLCVYVLIETSRVLQSVCVVKENVRLCLPFIQRYDRVIWANAHHIRSRKSVGDE